MNPQLPFGWVIGLAGGDRSGQRDMSLKLPGGSSVERQGGGDPMHHDQIEEGGLSVTLGTGGYHKASNFFQGRERGGRQGM